MAAQGIVSGCRFPDLGMGRLFSQEATASAHASFLAEVLGQGLMVTPVSNEPDRGRD